MIRNKAGIDVGTSAVKVSIVESLPPAAAESGRARVLASFTERQRRRTRKRS